MAEVVNMYIGGYGANVSENFWARLCLEHGIDLSTGKLCQETSEDACSSSDASGLRYIHRYFNETQDGCFKPRCIFIDSDRTELDALATCSQISRILDPDSIRTSSHGNC